MGASHFERQGFGKTIKEAYNQTCEELDDEIGHQDGYSGNLNSTRGYREIFAPEGVKPMKYVQWIETAAETLYDGIEPDKKRRIMKAIPEAYHGRVLSYAKIYDDKYGNALGIKLTGKAAKEYREHNGLKGKKGSVYHFFGFAPC